MHELTELVRLAKQYAYVWIPVLLLLGVWVWGKIHSTWRGPD